MANIFRIPIKGLKKAHQIINPEETNFGRNWKLFPVKEYANDLIAKELLEDRPTMIARLGSNELNCMVNYLGVKFPQKHKNVMGFIKNQTPQWWWNQTGLKLLKDVAGFFPVDLPKVEQFCEMMIQDLGEVDILGSWRKEEVFFKENLSNAKKVMLEDLEPFFVPNPWTKALEYKKVLVVHPFAETIEMQYRKRKVLFENEILPDFDLKVLKAVQSNGGEKTKFKDWFEALEHMKMQISQVDFDICILGCGAYGFPLASFVKKMGKKAVHLGGVSQILFGIKGKRWENYIVYPYTNLYNQYWVRPGENEKPANVNLVEGACYW